MPPRHDTSDRGSAHEAAAGELISVTVKLPGMLEQYRPRPARPAVFGVHLATGSTVSKLLERLGIPPKQAKLVFVDHVRMPPEAVLRNGARVEIYPPIAGG